MFEYVNQTVGMEMGDGNLNFPTQMEYVDLCTDNVRYSRLTGVNVFDLEFQINRLTYLAVGLNNPE